MVGVISVCIPMLIFVVMWFKRKDFDMKTMIIQTIIGGSLALVG